MAKIRVHNEYFRTVSLGHRKSCPSCYSKLGTDESIWSWGAYSAGRWYTVQHFCQSCWSAGYNTPRERLAAHKKVCGCTINLIGYWGTQLPAWLILTEVTNNAM